jgi:CubicO group peptidase (beta-lactamase class C family)
MRLLLALALAMGCLAAPAAAHDNPARDLTRTGIPGAVVLSDGDVDAAGNVRASDRFRVGSVTKTFTSTVILQLAAEHRLSLDDPIQRYVPGAPDIPLRRLLNHTSGIYNHSEHPGFFDGWPLKHWQPHELVAIAFQHPPYFPAGADFHYSNTNYVLLGLVIERVTGRSLERELERRILRPLGLRDTSYDEGPHVRGVAPGFVDAQNVKVQDTSWAGAAGALVSTARDLDRFYRALLSGRLLPRAQLAEMKTRDPAAGPYGLGLFTIRVSCGEFWGHDGAVPGYLAHAYTNGRRSVVVLVNRQPLSEPQTAAVNRALDKALCS